MASLAPQIRFCIYSLILHALVLHSGGRGWRSTRPMKLLINSLFLTCERRFHDGCNIDLASVSLCASAVEPGEPSSFVQVFHSLHERLRIVWQLRPLGLRWNRSVVLLRRQPQLRIQFVWECAYACYSGTVQKHQRGSCLPVLNFNNSRTSCYRLGSLDSIYVV